MTISSLEALPKKAWPIRYANNIIPVPAHETLRYLEGMEIMSAPGLALHIITSTLVMETLMGSIQTANRNKLVEEQICINKNTAHGIKASYHGPRLLADKAKKRVEGTDINSISFMEGHDDLDIATVMGVLNHLPLPVINGMMALQRERGFPHGTIGPTNRYQPEGHIDWTIAITQLASWQVDGGILPIQSRFESLIARHGDGTSAKALTKPELIGYRDWGITRLEEICNHLGIKPNEYHAWLKEQIFSLSGTPENPQVVSDQLTRKLFDREPKPNEFLPITPTYQWLAKSILGKSIGESIPGINAPVYNMKDILPRLIENPRLYKRLTK